MVNIVEGNSVLSQSEQVMAGELELQRLTAQISIICIRSGLGAVSLSLCSPLLSTKHNSIGNRRLGLVVEDFDNFKAKTGVQLDPAPITFN